MALNNYLTQVTRLLHDPSNQFYSIPDLTAYINEARAHIAAEGQCVRVLPPNGIGQNQTVAAQEVYTFASVNALNILGSGVASIEGVLNVSVSWGAQKPTLAQMVWSDFQARLRSYAFSLQNFPQVWAQYGQGVNGSIYLWPIPSQALAMDWDCWCLPVDLTSDSTPEAIPYPWTDAIKYYAAMLAYENSQRAEDADRKMKQYERAMKFAQANAQGPFIPNMYEP